MIKIVAFILFIPHLIIFFFSKKRSAIVDDLYSQSNGKSGTGFIVFVDLADKLFHHRAFRNLFYFRTSSFFSKTLRIFYPRDRYFIIDIRTKLGSGVHLAHPYSTILNAESIGDNLYVNHLVTVGEIEGRRPVIGKNVQLHAGSIIIGGITIGDNVIVGAGAVVVKDVPNNCTVVGNPSRVIKNQNIF